MDRQLSKTWMDRGAEAFEMAAAGFSFENSVIGDFGCGNQKVKLLLQQKLKSFKYQGYDILPQSPDVIRIDFNNEMPGESFDFVFCLGVLEYLKDVSRFLSALGGLTKYAVISYVASDSGHYPAAEVARMQWQHHFSSQEIEKLITENGFSILDKKFIDQNKTFLVFIKANGHRQ